MADAIDTLKNLLGDNAEEKIQAVMKSLSGPGSNTSSDTTQNLSPSPTTPVGVESILKIKGILDELENTGNDSRANLLYSLKPFMRTSRHNSIDSAVRILSLTKLTSIFKK